MCCIWNFTGTEYIMMYIYIYRFVEELNILLYMDLYRNEIYCDIWICTGTEYIVIYIYIYTLVQDQNILRCIWIFTSRF
jgi:hypothetical protein